MRKTLRPAILYKEEIEREIRKKYYTDDMFYTSASLENFMPSIKDDATYSEKSKRNANRSYIRK